MAIFILLLAGCENGHDDAGPVDIVSPPLAASVNGERETVEEQQAFFDSVVAAHEAALNIKAELAIQVGHEEIGGIPGVTYALTERSADEERFLLTFEVVNTAASFDVTYTGLLAGGGTETFPNFSRASLLPKVEDTEVHAFDCDANPDRETLIGNSEHELDEWVEWDLTAWFPLLSINLPWHFDPPPVRKTDRDDCPESDYWEDEEIDDENSGPSDDGGDLGGGGDDVETVTICLVRYYYYTDTGQVFDVQVLSCWEETTNE